MKSLQKHPDPQAQSGFKKSAVIPEDAEGRKKTMQEAMTLKGSFTPEEEMFKMAAKIKTFDEMEQDAKSKWESRNDVKNIRS